MSALSLSIDPAKFRKYGLKKRQINNAVKDALKTMAEAWHSRFLPLHFDESANQRYGYTTRKGGGMSPSQKGYTSSYVGRKRRKLGHNRPLVFSGAARSEALGSPKIRGTHKEARVVLPSKFNFRHPKSRVNMREEITRIIPEESRVLLDIGRARFRQLIQSPPQES